jgi:hypothetical protein
VSIPFLLDEKSAVVPVRLAGEQSGGKRKVSYGDARSNSERAAPSACIITQQEFLQKISEERATYQKLLNPVAQ